MYIEENKFKIKQNNQNGEEFENEVFDKVHRKLFIKELKKKNINLNSLFNRRHTLIEKHEFNKFIRNMIDNHGISVLNCVLYMEMVYINFRRILILLDEENIYLLRMELAKKNNIEIKRNKLFKYLNY